MWMRLLRGRLHGAGGVLDVFALGAGERSHARALHLAGDLLDGGEVAFGGDGEAGLQNIHAEMGELVRHPDLLGCVHGAAWRLLAVAQRRIEEKYLVVCAHRHFHCHNHKASLCVMRGHANFL